MKAYVLTTGVIFGAITLAHILRIIGESRALATDPWYMLLTILSASLCVWAWRVFRTLPRKTQTERS
jgi:hypothetical protein